MFLQICFIVGLDRSAVNAFGVSAVSAEIGVGLALDQTRLAIEHSVHFVFGDSLIFGNHVVHQVLSVVVGIVAFEPIVDWVAVLVELNKDHIAMLKTVISDRLALQQWDLMSARFVLEYSEAKQVLPLVSPLDLLPTPMIRIDYI